MNRENRCEVQNKRSNGVVPTGTAPLVFWDGYGLGHPYSGVGHYAYSLFEALRPIGVSPIIVSAEPVFFPCQNELVQAKSHLKKILNSKLIWPSRSYDRGGYLAKKSGEKAVFHGLSNITVPLKKKSGPATVVTIHDLIPLLAPRMVSPAYYLQFAFAIGQVIQSVDHIVTVSDWTARTIIERFPEAAGKLSVIKNGRPLDFRSTGKKIRDATSSVLTVSRFEPYKNLPVIGAIAERCKKTMTFDLVSDQRAEDFFMRTYGDLIRTGIIRLHKNLDEVGIGKLYEAADCYFQPSLYEGFCLPVMDAASYALPVAFLKGSAIDEIALPEFSVGAGKNDVEDFIDAIQGAVLKRNSAEFYGIAKEKFLGFPTWDDAALSLKNLYTALGT